MPNEEVPLLSPCATPTPMLSKNVGGKFKYLNRKHSEYLAGNSNAKCKYLNRKNSDFWREIQMQNANINANIKFSSKPKISPKPKIFARIQNFCPNQKFSPKPKIFAPT